MGEWTRLGHLSELGGWKSKWSRSWKLRKHQQVWKWCDCNLEMAQVRSCSKQIQFCPFSQRGWVGRWELHCGFAICLCQEQRWDSRTSLFHLNPPTGLFVCLFVTTNSLVCISVYPMFAFTYFCFSGSEQADRWIGLSDRDSLQVSFLSLEAESLGVLSFLSSL